MSFFSALKRLFGMSSGTPSLQPGDKLLVCEDCHSQFVFDAGEQRFFKEKGFTEPKRCPKCRKRVRFRMRRRGRGNQNNQNRNNQQQHNQNRHQNNNRNRYGNHGRRHSVIDGDSPYADER